MYVKEIKFEDFEGQERVEKHRFNMTQSELLDWVTKGNGGTVDKTIERMMEKNDAKGMIELITDLIHRSYGELSEDGRRFSKTPEIKANFLETNAYEVLLEELLTDAHAAAEFMNGVIPKKMREETEKYLKENPDKVPEEVREYLPK